MGCGQLHVRRSGEHLREPEEDGGGALEREDVGLRVRGDDQVARTERPHECLLRERGVVIVVDEQMVEERLGRGGSCLLDRSRREVDDAIGIQHVEVGPGEPGELEQPLSPRDSAFAWISSGVIRASWARRRNCRIWSANPRKVSRWPYAGHSEGSCPWSRSWTSAN